MGRLDKAVKGGEGKGGDLPGADEVQRGEDEAGGHGRGGSHKEGRPGVGRGDIDQAVHIMLDTQVRHIEQGTQQAARPVLEQRLQHRVDKRRIGALPHAPGALLLPQLGDDL